MCLAPACGSRRTGPAGFRPPCKPSHATTEVKRLRKQTLDIRQQNCLGLKSDAKLQEFTYCFGESKAFAATLQETWRTGREVLEVNGITLVLRGPSTQQGRGSKGIGFALATPAVKAWERAGRKEFLSRDKRSMGIRFIVEDGKGREMGLFLIAAYAPVGCAPDADWDEFFAGLDQVKKLAGADDIVVIGGDWNSSMGVGEKKDDFDGTDDRALATCGPLGPHGNPHTNDAGRRLLRYLALQDMVVPGTFFRKGKYSTWVHPCSKNGHQIDHFVTYKSDLRRVRDCGRKAQLVTSDNLRHD